MKLKDRVAIVTGGARGIGKAIALTFVREGAKVVLVDVDKKRLETLKNEIVRSGGEAVAISCDISKSSEVKEMINQVQMIFGRIDILVNNAGIIRRGTIETVTEEDWDQVMEVNLKGTFNCCKAVVGVMKRQGCGKIVNVSSIAGKMGDITSAPGYGPSKAAVDALTKTLARQLACYGINVNAVSPHAIETEMSAQWSEERRKEIIASIPLSRLGKPEDVAEAVLFLVSDSASFITGEILDVNGGALMD
ncbi:MAG TPA: SDR family NAD(P)-dependent oxidoreductase [Thermodesulfobacteriota bacterium]|nr:SDR family NAD(P)-dependent oxidoreductase [Thermodesulfobacteriota bacterium]